MVPLSGVAPLFKDHRSQPSTAAGPFGEIYCPVALKSLDCERLVLEQILLQMLREFMVQLGCLLLPGRL